MQIRHVHAHGNGRLDTKAVARLTAPFEGTLKPGMKIPFGTLALDFGTDFFIDVFAALISSIYLDLAASINHRIDCGGFAGEYLVKELPELKKSLPKTYNALINYGVLAQDALLA